MKTFNLIIETLDIKKDDNLHVYYQYLNHWTINAFNSFIN